MFKNKKIWILIAAILIVVISAGVFIVYPMIKEANKYSAIYKKEKFPDQIVEAIKQIDEDTGHTSVVMDPSTGYSYVSKGQIDNVISMLSDQGWEVYNQMGEIIFFKNAEGALASIGFHTVYGKDYLLWTTMTMLKKAP
jgi:hypothetical protein